MSHKVAKDEALWWGLFSAGGICFAIFVPAAALLFGVLMPMGMVSESAVDFETMRALAFSFAGFIFTGAVIVLPLFHSLHRIRHSCGDIKFGCEGFNKLWCYLAAIVLSVAALYVVIANWL